MTAPADPATLRRLAEAISPVWRDAWTARTFRQWIDGEPTAYIAALSPDRVLALLDRLVALEEALRDCMLAGRFGGELMDRKQRGGREKLAYIERVAYAGLAGTPVLSPEAFERLRAEMEARAALTGTPKP